MIGKIPLLFLLLAGPALLTDAYSSRITAIDMPLYNGYSPIIELPDAALLVFLDNLSDL